MPVTIDVDFDLMQAMIDNLTAALREFQAAGETLDGQAQMLLAAWEGDAAHAYEVRHAGWSGDHTLSAAELMSAITALSVALARYRRCDAQVLALVT